jgi:predicted RNA-binding Zn ribbon-like protein
MLLDKGVGGGGSRPALFVAERGLAVMSAVRDGGDATAIADVFIQHGEHPPVVLSPGERAGIEQVVRELSGLFDLESVDDWADALNVFMAQWGGPPRLAHEGVGWHLHADRGDNASWDEWFAASTGLALAVLLAEHGQPPGGRCVAEGCAQPYLRTWRGVPRRFCSSRCATRSRVREHRRRGAM